MTPTKQKEFMAQVDSRLYNVVSEDTIFYPQVGGLYAITASNRLHKLNEKPAKMYGKQVVLCLGVFITNGIIWPIGITAKRRGWFEGMIDGEWVLMWRNETKDALKCSLGAFYGHWDFGRDSKEYKWVKEKAKPMIPRVIKEYTLKGTD